MWKSLSKNFILSPDLARKFVIKCRELIRLFQNEFNLAYTFVDGILDKKINFSIKQEDLNTLCCYQWNEILNKFSGKGFYLIDWTENETILRKIENKITNLFFFSTQEVRWKHEADVQSE